MLLINGSAKKQVEKSSTRQLLEKVQEGIQAADNGITSMILGVSGINLEPCNVYVVCIGKISPLDEKNHWLSLLARRVTGQVSRGDSRIYSTARGT